MKTRPQRATVPVPRKTRARPKPPTRLRVHKILVPVDFSECSLGALRYAVRFAGCFGSRLLLAHVVEAFPIDYLLGLEAAKDSTKWMIERARAQLERLMAAPAVAGSNRVDRVVAFGKPYQELCALAAKESVDLIIIGTHGRVGLDRLQLGSTAERVVRHARCPVLVVRGSGSGRA